MNNPDSGSPFSEQPRPSNLYTPEFNRDEPSAEQIFIDAVLSDEWQQARNNRHELRQALLKEGSYESEEDFLSQVAPKTVVVYVAGGSASRWNKSFDTHEGAEVATVYGIDKNKSRFLAPLPSPLSGNQQPTIMDLNMLVERKLVLTPDQERRGKNVVIYGKDEDKPEIEAVIERNNLQGTSVHKQKIISGREKPAGHAEALLQTIDLIKGSLYVITHFGGDVSSPQTITDSLLAMDVQNKNGADVRVMIPTANLGEGKNNYPVLIDSKGIPKGLGHSKLLGESSLRSSAESGLRPAVSNVGVRVYHGPTLRHLLVNMWESYKDKDEFALDNIDQVLFEYGLGRQLCIANPNEIRHPGKTLMALAAQLDAWKDVLQENGYDVVK